MLSFAKLPKIMRLEVYQYIDRAHGLLISSLQMIVSYFAGKV